MQIGDKVLYVPSKDHARDLNKDGSFAWAYTQKVRGEPKPIGAAELKKLFAKAKRSKQKPAGIEASHPTCVWPATVTAVDSGKASLDIESPAGGVTLHYDNVPIDEAKGPGSCHAIS